MSCTCTKRCILDWEIKLQQVALTVCCGFVFRLLVNLIKRKPQMTEEQIKTIADGFTAMVDKCCKQSDIETCFGEEVFPISFKNKTKQNVYRKVETH